jgi:hypothetical protein
MLEHALQGALKPTLGGKRTATRKLHSIMRTWGPGLVSLPVTTRSDGFELTRSHGKLEYFAGVLVSGRYQLGGVGMMEAQSGE